MAVINPTLSTHTRHELIGETIEIGATGDPVLNSQRAYVIVFTRSTGGGIRRWPRRYERGLDPSRMRCMSLGDRPTP